MSLAYIFVGMVAGLLASLVAFVLSSSFLLAAKAYVLVGSFTMLLLPLALFARRETFADDSSSDAMLPTLLTLPKERSPQVEQSMRILAVDDDPFILELIPILSEKAGFLSVTIASSGDQALKLLANCDLKFDCFLFDIGMPEMDGVELCRRVRQMPDYAKTPILMLTAMRDLKDMADAFRAGATDYATKPFDIEELTIRLSMAQKAIIAARDFGQVNVPAQTGAGPVAHAGSSTATGGLVDQETLDSYLTQLPQKEASAVQVYAFTFEEADTSRPGFSPHQSASLLQAVLSAATNNFEADTVLMAFGDPSTLLLASTSSASQANVFMELKIEGLLHHNGYDVAVAIGGPVLPHGPKYERARQAFDVALKRAQIRHYEKKTPYYFDAKNPSFEKAI